MYNIILHLFIVCIVLQGMLYFLSFCCPTLTRRCVYVCLFSSATTTAAAVRPASVPRTDSLLQLLGGCYSPSHCHLAQRRTTITPGWVSHVGPALWWDMCSWIMSLYYTLDLLCHYINTWETADGAQLKHVFNFIMLMYLLNGNEIHIHIVLIFGIQNFEPNFLIWSI
jgi:hypothetical protein